MDDDQFYDTIIDVIDAVKTDERSQDSDDYASAIFVAAEKWLAEKRKAIIAEVVR